MIQSCVTFSTNSASHMCTERERDIYHTSIIRYKVLSCVSFCCVLPDFECGIIVLRSIIRCLALWEIPREENTSTLCLFVHLVYNYKLDIAIVTAHIKIETENKYVTHILIHNRQVKIQSAAKSKSDFCFSLL